MKRLRNAFLHAIAASLVALPALATIPTIAGFVTQADGNVVTASIWNSQIGAIYSYINTNLVAAWNVVTTKGDIWVYDGSNVQRLGVGTNGQVLTSDSGQSYGLAWESPVSTTTLSATGDLLGYQTGTGLVRLPVGTNGQVLTANSGSTGGVNWQTPVTVPPGAILMWSGSIASIPSGYVLCDGVQSGSTGTAPNLQGLFIVGAGNTSPAASGGMGLLNPGGPSGQTSNGPGQGPSHSHTITLSVNNSFGSGSQGAIVNAVNQPSVVTPRYYALCYIMKT